MTRLDADNSAAAWVKTWAGTVRVPTADLWAFVNTKIEECAREHKACRNSSGFQQ
ncbi:hypothetical protein GY45DRAFT_1318291 [Cubamyces sp. BRFM 1775]|nr:hypothetical protein GY45DRAFT_1318291 [Cubamyces sp. BRFM 1775]